LGGETMHEDVLSIEEAFGDLKDPRSRTPAHDLMEMLMVALCAILSGADSWIGIELWGQTKLDGLRRYIPLEQGIPSHDTFRRVFAALNPKQFEACFIRWMGHLCPALTGQVVAIDGKTVRGSHGRGQRAIHLVSAYGSGLDVVLGQVRTADKSNEITGAIVTIDAMGCQSAIAARIVKAGADYVLAVKGTSPRYSRTSARQSRPSSVSRRLIAMRSSANTAKLRKVMDASRRAGASQATSSHVGSNRPCGPACARS
jgi:hypothetical protein